MSQKADVVVVGAGAIGSSVVGWIASHYENLYLLARGESATVIKENGLKLYVKGKHLSPTTLPVKVIESLSEISPPTILILTVKNYDLNTTAKEIRDQLGNNEPIIVALQNGVENQQILPQYFTKIIYSVVSYNAWREGPGVVWHDPKGFIIIGTPENTLQKELREVADILLLGLECSITDRFQDAAHCKLVVNLGNALMTLLGFQKRPVKSFRTVMKIVMQLFWEGIQLLQMAGYKEHPLKGIPSWKIIKLGKTLPSIIVSSFYKLNSRKIGLNSMSQDVFGGRPFTELESLNGYMLSLASQVGFSMPINEAIYEMAKERFGPDFQPVTETELWAAIQKKYKEKKRKNR